VNARPAAHRRAGAFGTFGTFGPLGGGSGGLARLARPALASACAVLAAFAVVAEAGAARAAAGSAEPAPCRTRTRIQPSRAFAGQPIAYEVEILRRSDVVRAEWLEAPRFPGFRAEWLPGRTAHEPVEREGRRYVVTTERRVLFAARPGPHRIPAASLACHLEGGGQAVAPVEGGRVQVEPLPDAGRPPQAPPLVGPVRVVTRVEPEEIALGGTARLWVLVRGPGNVWEAEAPFGESLPGAELFPEPPTLDADTGTGLRLTRTFRYRIVPRHAGTLRIPAVEIPWFDPERDVWETARGPARELRVEAAPPPEPAAPGAAARQEAAGAAPGEDASPPLRRIGALVLALAVVLLVGVLGGFARHRRRRRSGWGEVESALRRARHARRTGDPEAAAAAQRDALRRALESVRPGARTRTAEELCRAAAPDSALAEAAALLADLERARFAGAPPRPLDPAPLDAALRHLREEGGRS